VAKARGLKFQARIVAHATNSRHPSEFTIAPVGAIEKVLARAGWQVGDVDLWEINEAFATVPMKTARDLGVSLDRVNVNGGAIAMGHPLGATGAVILGTLLDELERSDKATGVATLCVGAGMGIATVIERI
jgi:acetyl-CoA C-acetyltransferase